MPERVHGAYMWQKTVTTYATGNTRTSSPVCITGADGLDGADAVILRVDSTFGPSAYLQWYFRKQADQEWSTMSVSDSHLTEGGFCMNVTPDDVDEQILFQCDLNV